MHTNTPCLFIWCDQNPNICIHKLISLTVSMSRMIINSRAFCWRNWDSDEDEETSIVFDDYDSDQEAAASGRFWLNGSDSDGCDSDTQDDGVLKIYPGVDYEYLTYRHAHLRDFSRSAIEQYNRDTGNRYEFVELVEASVLPLDKADFVVVTFKARQSDAPMVTTFFRADTHSASKSLSHSYHIERVVPLHSHSDTSKASIM